jgi:hypothetical protein
MEPGLRDVGVRAADHALDAALAEYRRALRLASDSRERERMARSRAVKLAADASAAALEQPVERPMRGVKLAETWIEVDRVRHPLDAAVRARPGDGELRVAGEGWTARLVLPPGEGPANVAREAAARIEAAGQAATDRARARLRVAAEAALAHAATCHEAASALAALDREVAERHADRGRVDACAAELAERLGPRRLDEPEEAAAARERLTRARQPGEVEEPYAWIAGWPPEVAGAMLRDLPEPAEHRDAMRGLLGELQPGEAVLALGATVHGAAAVTTVRSLGPVDGALGELRPGRVAAFAELLRRI